MQIELKVVKGIKKSLISQIQPLSRAEVTDKNFIVIGWCRYKHSSKLTYDLIIFHNGFGELRKMVKFHSIEESERGITLKNNYLTLGNLSFEPETEEEYIDLLSCCWKIHNDVKEKGQFYV